MGAGGGLRARGAPVFDRVAALREELALVAALRAREAGELALEQLEVLACRVACQTRI